MKPRVRLGWLVLLAMVVGWVATGWAAAGASAAAAVTVTAAATAAKGDVVVLAWLAGTSRFERNGRVVTERWTAPSGGMMLGTSQTVANGKTVEYEFVVIRAGTDGVLAYVAKPSRQPEATFRLVRLTEREVIFENPQHDYPQRISYQLKEDGALVAAIDGTKNGKSRRVEFPYRKVN